jgi:hypothetical protein
VKRLTYAFRFIYSVFKLSENNLRLQKPWMSLAVGSLVLLLLWFLPLALVVSLIGLQPAGLMMIGLICVLIALSLAVWGEVMALQTSRVFDGMIDEQDNPESAGDQTEKSNEFTGDVASYLLSLPGLRFRKFLNENFSKDKSQLPSWVEDAYLVLPVMANENMVLDQAEKRVEQIAAENRIKVRPDLMSVNLLARIVQWILMIIGVVVGFVVARNIADPLSDEILIQILATGIGLLIAGFFTTAGILFSAFSRICYHTALYRWARNVEVAAQTGAPEKAAPPVILTQALGLSPATHKE